MIRSSLRAGPDVRKYVEMISDRTYCANTATLTLYDHARPSTATVYASVYFMMRRLANPKSDSVIETIPFLGTYVP